MVFLPFHDLLGSFQWWDESAEWLHVFSFVNQHHSPIFKEDFFLTHGRSFSWNKCEQCGKVFLLSKLLRVRRTHSKLCISYGLSSSWNECEQCGNVLPLDKIMNKPNKEESWKALSNIHIRGVHFKMSVNTMDRQCRELFPLNKILKRQQVRRNLSNFF